MKHIHSLESFLSESKNKGLWANIRAKRARGEKPAEPGDEDYPDEKAWKAAQKASESNVNESNDNNVTLNVTISNIDQSTADDFLKMFAFMQWCGNVGAGRTFRGYFDGDGHFRPNIKIEGVDLKKLILAQNQKEIKK